MPVSRRGKQVPSERKHAIIDMARAGLTKSYIARFYVMPRSTVSSIVTRKQVNDSAVEKRGRKSKLSQRCIRRLIRCISSNRFKPLFVVASEFRTTSNEKLSVRSIRR